MGEGEGAPPASAACGAGEKGALDKHADKPQVKTVSFDDMWTYLGARRGKKRRSAWIWTAVAVEWDGSRWADFEVGYRDAETFLRLLRRLPEAAKYRERPITMRTAIRRPLAASRGRGAR